MLHELFWIKLEPDKITRTSSPGFVYKLDIRTPLVHVKVNPKNEVACLYYLSNLATMVAVPELYGQIVFY